jgi:hypothetical protein
MLSRAIHPPYMLSQGRPRMLFVFLLAAICLVSCAPCPACGPQAPCPTCEACPDCTPCTPTSCQGGTGFEDLAVGTTYHSSDTLTSSGLTIPLLPFQWMDGQWITNGQADVRNDMQDETDNAMFLNNVNLGFDIEAQCIRIRYCDLGGNVNFIANGVENTADDFQDMAGIDFNGLTFGVYDVNDRNCGTIETKGSAERFVFQEGWTISFAIGGQELYVDDVCPCQ